MRKETLTALTALIVAGAFAIPTAIAQTAADTGHDAVEKYGKFAEDNPDLIGDRNNGIDPVPADDPSRTVDDAQVYPEPVDENPDLTADTPEQERPYTEETDVHGAFGKENPDIQR
jgi:hypothetical protein